MNAIVLRLTTTTSFSSYHLEFFHCDVDVVVPFSLSSASVAGFAGQMSSKTVTAMANSGIMLHAAQSAISFRSAPSGAFDFV